MKVIVTGGTGYLGRAVVRAVDGDVRDRPALERAAAGCDALCHAAALVSIWRRRREDFDDVNVGGLRNALAVARSLNVARIVYTSSFVALTPRDLRAPIAANDYQRTKLAADRLADDAVRDGTPL